MGRGTSKAGATTSTMTANVPNVPTNAVPLTDADAKKLRDQQDSMYDATTTAAVKMYISNTNFDNQGHSLSQTMNYLEDNGVDFNDPNTSLQQINKQFGLNLDARQYASMQYTSNIMDIAGHPLGKDVVLQRGAHDDILRQGFGIADYSQLSEKQLKQKLVGQSFTNNSNMSTSYDVSKNPFLGSGSGVSGGREVVYNIKAGANTKVLFGAKAQSEIVIGKGTNFRITDVKYTGNIATPRGGRSKKQIVIDIETF